MTLPKPGDDAVLGALSRPSIPNLRIDRLPSGIDGRHIDVALGPPLDKATRMYVGALMHERLAPLWNESPVMSSAKLVELFREQVRQHHQTAVAMAQDGAAMEQIQLFQLALVKLVLQHADGELTRVRAAIEDERLMRDQQMSGKALRLHRQAALLGRNAAHIRYRTVRLVLREINRLDHAAMRSLRQSVLGRSWPVAEVMLNNPLLALNGVGSLRDFIEHYPAALHELSPTRVLAEALFLALADWLPQGVVERDRPGRKSPEPMLRTDDAGLPGMPALDPWVRALVSQSERAAAVTTWLDDPDNVTALLGGAGSDWPAAGPWARHDLSNLQRQLNARFGRAVARTGVQRQVEAAYALNQIYPTLGLRDAEAAVFDYLTGKVDRQGFGRRLETSSPHADPVQVARRIDERFKAFRRGAGNQKRPQLARLAGDILRLRRDLKLIAPTLTALARIRLLDDPEALRLSREHNSLQLFYKQSPLPDLRGNLVGHTIVRVELRGANELVAGMARRGLNPAAHFSRFLYDPLFSLLKRFDAQKIMVEAGTLVLATLQHTGEGGARLAVARACALAQSLMEQIGALNGESERLGLSSLECSLAVVFDNMPPTFLYDQQQPVLVSSANTRARRMSACNALLHRSCTLPAGQRVCVATPLDAGEQSPAREHTLRYNVNGIELDASAFARLHAEIAMRKVRLRDPRSDKSIDLSVGQCPDGEGGLHWLVVRQGTVKLWMGRQLIEPPEQGAAFYEVVVDPALVNRVRERLIARDQAAESRMNTGSPLY
jgi:hypothetical protein